MRLLVKMFVDDKEIILSDRDYSNQPLNWKLIENAKVDAMVKLNKIMSKDLGVNFS